jgi:hypothetical protein
VSGLHPYCVTIAGCHPPDGLEGLGGRIVEGWEIESLTVWTSEEPSAPRPDLEAVVRHDAVVRAANERVTSLPVRFGAWAPDRTVLVGRIQRRRAELEAALAAVSGCVELGVTVEDTSGSERDEGQREASDPVALLGQGANGKAYLRQLSRHYAGRRRRRAERAVLLERLRSAAGPLAIDERVHRPPRPALLAVAHLVARSEVERYRERLDEFAHEHDATRVRVSGPWPPYSFAGS